MKIMLPSGHSSYKSFTVAAEADSTAEFGRVSQALANTSMEGTVNDNVTIVAYNSVGSY